MILIPIILVAMAVGLGGLFLLAKTQKENLGKLFSISSYVVITTSVLIIVFGIAIAIAHCCHNGHGGCGSHGKAKCGQSYNGHDGGSSCPMMSGSCSSGKSCSKSGASCYKSSSCSKGSSCKMSGKSCSMKGNSTCKMGSSCKMGSNCSKDGAGCSMDGEKKVMKKVIKTVNDGEVDVKVEVEEL